MILVQSCCGLYHPYQLLATRVKISLISVPTLVSLPPALSFRISCSDPVVSDQTPVLVALTLMVLTRSPFNVGVLCLIVHSYHLVIHRLLYGALPTPDPGHVTIIIIVLVILCIRNSEKTRYCQGEENTVRHDLLKLFVI